MGSSISKQSDTNILQLFNLFHKKSLFYQNSKECFLQLIKTIYQKELTKKKDKLHKLTKMTIDDYIKEKKIINEENDIDKTQFIKLLSRFTRDEITTLLQTTKKNIFIELKKEFS
tara:strand:- start:611 stop:955 length:345 start_codon:yes stop_codon:yes gene_type:complete